MDREQHRPSKEDVFELVTKYKETRNETISPSDADILLAGREVYKGLDYEDPANVEAARDYVTTLAKMTPHGHTYFGYLRLRINDNHLYRLQNTRMEIKASLAFLEIVEFLPVGDKRLDEEVRDLAGEIKWQTALHLRDDVYPHMLPEHRMGIFEDLIPDKYADTQTGYGLLAKMVKVVQDHYLAFWDMPLTR